MTVYNIILCSLEPGHTVLVDRLLEQVQSEIVAQHCQITHLEVEERSHEIATAAPPLSTYSVDFFEVEIELSRELAQTFCQKDLISLVALAVVTH